MLIRRKTKKMEEDTVELYVPNLVLRVKRN